MIRALRPTLLAALTLAAPAVAPTAALAAPAPRMPIASFSQLPQPLPLPYVENANADRQVAAARARARAKHRLLLIDLGGNWCLDCRILAGTIGVEPLKSWVAAHYEVVTVDIGHFDRNLQVQRRYGITGRLEGVPALLVVDPRTNKLLDAGHVAALADARSMNPQALADWLASWTR